MLLCQHRTITRDIRQVVTSMTVITAKPIQIKKRFSMFFFFLVKKERKRFSMLPYQKKKKEIQHVNIRKNAQNLW